MERDFLGVVENRKESAAAVVVQVKVEQTDLLKFMAKVSPEGRPMDSSFVGSPGLQWPVLSKAPLQPFASTKEERPKKIEYEQISSSLFPPISAADPLDAHRGASSATKKSFTLDNHGTHIRQGSQFALPCVTYPAQGDGQGASIYQHLQELRSTHSIAAAANSPYCKLNIASANASLNNIASVQPFGGMSITSQHSVLPVAAPSSFRAVYGASTKPPSAAPQLTIFYAGSVHVYDDIPLEKAQAIMLLAGGGIPMSQDSQNHTIQVSSVAKGITDGFHGSTMASSCSGFPSPVSGTSQLQQSASHSGVQSAGGSTSTDELVGVRNINPLAQNIQQEPPKPSSLTTAATLIPRGAIPQARKKSLARFLEKRKERVSSAAPYPKSEACTENNSAGFSSGLPAAAWEENMQVTDSAKPM